jgi:hypothetical protein
MTVAPSVLFAASDSPGDSLAAHETWGSLDPGKGFLVAETKQGDLSISAYAMFRYLNQLPADQIYLDHLGRERAVHARNDLQFHRVQVFFKGWVYDPRIRYVMNVWTVNSTGQIALVGNMSYRFGGYLTLYAGVNGIPGTRSLGGSHPYWLAPDRVLADEFFRPGFTSGVWATGQALPRFYYTAMVGTNLSELGISATEDTRDLAYGGTLWWMPTTGEFGPRGAYGDYERHQQVATRFGVSAAHSREDRFSQLSQRSPDNTSIRLSDALNLFETDALAPGVTMQKANYTLFSADAGLKRRGLFLQTEFYFRWLDHFAADGPLPLSSIYDNGFMVQAAQMLTPSFELYSATSYIFGQFNDSWEVLGGANVYLANTRNVRLNFQVIRVDRSAVNSSFGYYVGGQSGTTFSVASSILF